MKLELVQCMISPKVKHQTVFNSFNMGTLKSNVFWNLITVFDELCQWLKEANIAAMT